MGDLLISVVIPIYNVENYLDRCMNSVINQTYHNLEIIMVDDDSPDRCPDICDDWEKRDKRIKVIHKKNEGLGMARNTGIENATGDYICFFDSDDYMSLDTIEKGCKLAKEEQSDIVIWGFCRIKGNGVVTSTIIPKTKRISYSNDEVLNVFLPDLIAPDLSNGRRTNLHMNAWSCLYSMALIRKTNWRFVSEREIISEDIYSLLYLYKNVRKVSVLPEALYYYCENPSSLTHTYRKDRFEKIKQFYCRCILACDELGYSEEIKIRLTYPYLSNTIASLKMLVNADLPYKEKNRLLRQIISDEQLQDVIGGLDLRYERIGRKSFVFAMKYKLLGVSYLLIKVKS